MLDSDDRDGLPDDDVAGRKSTERSGPLLWPWLVLLGVLTIGVGVVGALSLG